MKDEKMILRNKELQDIVRGACFLGSGGGGPYVKSLRIASTFDSEVEVVSVKEAMLRNKTGYAAVTALMGAPENVTDTLMGGALNKVAIERLVQEINIDISEIKYLIPVEIGATSSLISCMAASLLEIPVIDADGAGRAVPKLNMTTFATEYKYAKVNPTVLVANDDEYVILKVTDGPEATATIEELARPILSMPKFNQVGAIALWLIEVKHLKKVLPIQGTLTKCLNLGQCIRTYLEETETPNLDGILTALDPDSSKCKLKLECTLISATTSTKGGFDNGSIELQKTGTNERLTIVFQNESLLLWSEEESGPRVLAPDLISYIIPPEGTNKQWVYSNTDIMGEDGKLKKKLIGRKIILIAMEAPNELKDHAIKLALLQKNALEKSPTLHDSYKNMLKELNYFGNGESSF